MNRIRLNVAIVVPLLVLLAFGFQACSRPPAPEFRINATIKDLMDSTMDPNADALWDSVEVDATLAGVTKKEPKTDDDWKVLKRHAITLTEISNLLLMDGRHVASPAKSRSERVDLSPKRSKPASTAIAPAGPSLRTGCRTRRS
jgi:hypothetical protein